MSVVPSDAIVNLSSLLVASLTVKTPSLFLISKSSSLLLSTREIFGPALVILIFALALNSPDKLVTPVVAIVCDPKSGEIFVPAIAALALISALTIAPSAIFADVTELSGIPPISLTYLLQLHHQQYYSL